MLDAGYDAHKNYEMIRDSDRRPVICTCKNHVARGFSPRAEMIRWQENNPEEFEDVPPVQHNSPCSRRSSHVHCNDLRKDTAGPKAAAQARLLQRAVVME